jgi:hypothetical protein
MITILIPFFSQNQYRIRNIKAVISNYLKNFTDCKVVVVEQVPIDSKFTSECFVEFKSNANFHVYPLQVEGDRFNKSFLINTAVREYIESDIIMMSDADCILPQLSSYYLRSQLQDTSIYFPFSKVNFLNEAHTRRLLSEKPLIQASVSQDHFINRYTGLVNLFTRSTFNSVGGFDESFEGWGGEDDAFVDKCNRIVAPIRRSSDDTTLIHLYHPKVNTSEYLNTECFTWNKKRVATIRRMPLKRLQSYVEALQDGVNVLDDIVREFDRDGKLSFSAVISIGSGTINVDTTVYDIIPKDGKVELDGILDAVYRTDGHLFLAYIISQIDSKISDMTDEETHIVEKYRAMCQ